MPWNKGEIHVRWTTNEFHNARGIPYLLSPIVTRWGTWTEAAVFFAGVFEMIESIISSLNEEDCAPITIGKDSRIKISDPI